jgi:hypothetical protein
MIRVVESVHEFQGQVLALHSLSMFHGLGIVSVVMAVSPDPGGDNR